MPLALLSGLLLAASFPRFGHPALAWIALTPLTVSVALAVSSGRVGWRNHFALGAAAGIVFFLGAVYWVVNVMAQYGGISVILAVPIGGLLFAYLAIYPGIFAVLLGRAVARWGVSGVWTAPALWVVTEWLRATVGGGFPWALLGASQATLLPVAQLASVTGVYGLSALVALVSTAAAALALSRSGRHLAGAGVVLLLLIVNTAAGAFRLADNQLTRTGAVIRVGLVQGNVAQDQKWDPAYRDEITGRYLSLSRQAIDAGARLVVWPEAATPFFFDVEDARAEPIRRLARETRTPFLIGTDEYRPPTGGEPERFYNSAVLVGSDGRTRAGYRKMQLVPFGEYVPLQRLLFFVGPLVEKVSHFTAGEAPTVLSDDSLRVGVSICYESVYPWLARSFVRNGSQLLATITNDAWFGRSSAAYQHFEQAAVRAVEQGRFLVRAANTGISGVVDPYGRVLAATPLFEATTLAVDVRLHESSTIYARVGDVVVWMSLLLAAWVLAGARTRLPETL